MLNFEEGEMQEWFLLSCTKKMLQWQLAHADAGPEDVFGGDVPPDPPGRPESCDVLDTRGGSVSGFDWNFLLGNEFPQNCKKRRTQYHLCQILPQMH